MPATGGFKSIKLVWTNSTTLQLGQMEIWGSQTNDRATAVLRDAPAAVPGLKQIWTHTGLKSGATWFYWIRSRNRSGATGNFVPSNPLGGITATTTLIESDDLSATAEGTTRRLLEEIYVELLGIRDAMLEQQQ